jgi:hypothetical protein
MADRFWWRAIPLIVLFGAAEPCAAQNTPAPQIVDPKACSEQQQLPRDPGPPANPSNQTSSERLARTDGVICPPSGVDPKIASPPPGGGKTPVIPPPGSPGGDPTVRPK